MKQPTKDQNLSPQSLWLKLKRDPHRQIHLMKIKFSGTIKGLTSFLDIHLSTYKQYMFTVNFDKVELKI